MKTSSGSKPGTRFDSLGVGDVIHHRKGVAPYRVDSISERHVYLERVADGAPIRRTMAQLTTSWRKLTEAT